MQQVEKYIELGQAVIKTEIQAVSALIPRVNQQFGEACDYLLNCQGRIVVIGMGKSGHIGNKIAATLASTGSPAFFVHPGEASHGDLGMITRKDVVIAISNSGESSEINTILPLLNRYDIPLISLTGNPDSTLAQAATINIDVSVEKEACPLGLAPTASTTACLVMGDALAIALLQARGFTAEDFALSHPGGKLGRRLLMRIKDLMHHKEQIPRVSTTEKLSQALVEVTQKGFGITTVIDAAESLCGVFTDGDLRRAIERGLDLHTTPICEVMTTDCKTGHVDMLIVDAFEMMKEFKISALIVVDDEKKPAGILHMPDILRAGII